VLLDTRAVADTETVRQGRFADIAKVQAGGIDALIPELPTRWVHSSHRARVGDLMGSMARSIGDRGQFKQQQAMLARPDSHADLRAVSANADCVWPRGYGDTARRARADARMRAQRAWRCSSNADI
jgi:hypothetical protein